MKETIDKAIVAHSRWKIHLKNAIKTGKCNSTVEEVQNSHACKLGEWLDSAAGKALPSYQELFELHREFHQEASHVLHLALTGQKSEATEKMDLGSQFSQLTAKLVNKLAEVRGSENE
ncbi:CZB domain-containing protein [Candidatus Parabeggiatoa sp. HSG14]|uniref:CZB domain-containing protein n=1 Tax=Candidatus Parabeggiatoa sp. HSG14 TaxID=3055593 RepID=UPI0025A8C979|nr:CZB domain-containing protein [Thiotrichales bacterium HSG14]